MGFTGPTEQRIVKVSSGKQFKLFMTPQEGGFWASTVLFATEGKVEARNMSAISKIDAYQDAVNWILANLDSHAEVDPF